MITDDKNTEIFCTEDEFSKNFDSELEKNLLSVSGNQRRRRKATMSDSEIMTVQLMFHLGGYKCFKHFYIYYILGSRKDLFPTAVSYNRFVELESRVFFVMMFFLKMSAFGRCNGVSYVDSTMIPVCHNVRRYMNKVFKGGCRRWKGDDGLVPRLLAVLRLQRPGGDHHLLPHHLKHRRPRSQGVEGVGQGPIWQAVRRPRIHLAKALRRPLRRRHTPRHRHQVQHEEQTHAALGQDNAAQTLCHRVHQRHTEEHRVACPLASPLHQQLHHEPRVRAWCLLFLRQQVSCSFWF